ncbi:MAG: hypothetical protein HY904_06320 [Deltaproteobacteria bacterium]|nr:hypothetical protein [Deltaproteobacteria bacterium]
MAPRAKRARLVELGLAVAEDVVERFDRAGTPMVRVRFPKNPQAQERVLRVSRIQVVEPAKTGEGRG